MTPLNAFQHYVPTVISTPKEHTMPTIDTLKLKTRLSESGMPESQAQVLAEELDRALSSAITRGTPTKADTVELRGTVRSLDERLKGEIRLLRWMTGAKLLILVGIGIRILFMQNL